jgi:hypothetical protein
MLGICHAIWPFCAATIAWLNAGIEALQKARAKAYIDHGLLTNLELRIHALVNVGAKRLLCILLVLPRTHDGTEQKRYLRLRLEGT